MRGSGRTTKQMVDAPQGAVFVWLNDHIEYPQRLARSLAREDLVVVRRSWLAPQHWEGRRFSGVVIDHALRVLSAQEGAWLRDLRAYAEMVGRT